MFLTNLMYVFVGFMLFKRPKWKIVFIVGVILVWCIIDDNTEMDKIMFLHEDFVLVYARCVFFIE